MPVQPTFPLPTPVGFLRSAAEGEAELSWTGQGWLAAGEPLGDRLDADGLARLRPLRGLNVRWPSSRVPVEVITDLAASGVPLHAADTPAWVEPELAGLLAAWTPEEGDGSRRSVTDLRREEHSVRLRRHGLRSRAGAAAEPVAVLPKVSVVMSSMRPYLLASALDQIARQRRVEVEVLLGLHGVPAEHEAVRRAVREFDLPITVVEAGAEIPFGEVLNRAASRASGDHITKWDDDDWYGPEHLADLLLARSHTGADIVGTTAEFFYLEPLNATIRRTDYTSEIWSEHVAGGTILLDLAAFQELGGFPALRGGVDAAFLKAARAEEARIYRTHGLGYMLRRSVSTEHTWQLSLAHFLRVASNQWRGFRPSLILERP
ncbi:glycosyltransferase family A protein [Streptosporangium subroseum]|uniref:glycosyltransferase family A protein n=1 Tax=Streptosporangium subroseum TaxID=106412 RepID=UPI0034482B50